MAESPKTPETSELTRVGYVVAAKDAVWEVLPLVMADVQTGEILSVTKFAADLFGYAVEELTGKALEILVPDEVRTTHAAWRADTSVPKTRLMGLGRLVLGRRKGGEMFPCHVGLMTMTHRDRQIGIAFVVDITVAFQVAVKTTPVPALESLPAPSEPKPEPPELSSASPLTGTVKMGALLAGLLAIVALLFLWKILAGGDTMTVQDQIHAAICNMRERRYEQAAEMFVKAADNGADAILSLGGAAECLFYLKRYDESLNLCDRLNRTAPNAGRAHYVRGLVLRKQGQEEPACKEFRLAARHGDTLALTLLPRVK